MGRRLFDRVLDWVFDRPRVAAVLIGVAIALFLSVVVVGLALRTMAELSLYGLMP